jgi:hypothetical protein
MAPTERSPLLQDPESQSVISGSNNGSGSERRDSVGDASSHQGMPEVRRQMKYIFPAVAVGVRTG